MKINWGNLEFTGLDEQSVCGLKEKKKFQVWLEKKGYSKLMEIFEVISLHFVWIMATTE